MKKKFIYLDHASATPLAKQAVSAMDKYSKLFFGNPSSIHRLGLDAKNVLNAARSTTAQHLGAHSDEIIFTGSATEANALAILGTVYKYNEIGLPKVPHVVSTKIEHASVLENLKLLESRGQIQLTLVPPEHNGIVDPKKIFEAIKENTILVSVMYANNEIGTIQPIQEIAKVVRRIRKHRQEMQILSRVGAPAERVKREKFVSLARALKAPAKILPLVLHTDACQAMNYLFTENIEKLGVDMLTFNSAKIYGPKGVGVLYKKRNVSLAPVYIGGEQEMGLRSGTEDVVRIQALALAFDIACKMKKQETVRLAKIRDFVFKELPKLSKSTGYDIHINGDLQNRLPNNINISIAGISSELLVIELDALGIFVSSKSACKSTEEESSHVINALRDAGDDFITKDSLRITLGRENTLDDLKMFLKSLKKILEKYKNL